MKKTRPFRILFFIALLSVMFIGNNIFSVIEAEGSIMPNDSVSVLLKKAEQGDADAQFDLGVMYDMGQDVPQNYSEAVKWYRKAAEQGHPGAQFGLGVMYYEGQGVPQNYGEAVSWYRKAAEQGHAVPQFYLGFMYNNGYGVSKNYVEAAKWYRKAAEQGYGGGQHLLGICYEFGEGVPQNYKTAYIWLSLAAANLSGELQKAAADQRDLVAKKLSVAALEQAQQIASEWKPKTGNKE